MDEHTLIHKTAWEAGVYDFWIAHNGTPQQLAAKILSDPKKSLKKYAQYFDVLEGVCIANICGSCGKKAVPLAALGAEVTLFDLSEDNRRYATELACAAHVPLNFVLCDVMSIDPLRYHNTFDILFMEGGILHYFHDLHAFMNKMNALLRPGGKMILSDFHPFTKVCDSLGLELPAMSYFSTDIFEAEMAHARFYPEPLRSSIPKCSYRKYTLSEIINSTISSGFVIARFDEHPAWNNPSLPGEFTLVAHKSIKPTLE